MSERPPHWLIFEGLAYERSADFPGEPPWTHVDRAAELEAEGDRAHKWKARAEAAEEALTSIWIYLRLDGQHKTHERFGAACGVDACILCLALATAKKPLESRGAVDDSDP